MAQQQPTTADYQRLGDSKEAVVKRADLPLHCPMDNNVAWCAHPRVFLSIEDSANKTARCPYCGTLYRLID